MKTPVSIFLLFSIFAASALAELTQQDIHQIRMILKEELKTEIEASEKRMKEYIDIRFQSVDNRVENVSQQTTHTTVLIYALFVLIIIAIWIPQILIAWRENREQDQEQKRINEELRQEIEMLKKQRIISS